MDKVINLTTLDTHEVPDTVMFDVSRLVKSARMLLTTRNAAVDSVIEINAGLELLLKELAVTKETVHLNHVDIYGVEPKELEGKFELEVGKPLMLAYPYLEFADLNLIDLRGTTAIYQLVTVEINESNYKYI